MKYYWGIEALLVNDPKYRHIKDHDLSYPDLLQAVIEEGKREGWGIVIGYEHDLSDEQVFINIIYKLGLILTPPKEETKPNKRICATCNFIPGICCYPLVEFGSCDHWEPKQKPKHRMTALQIAAFCEGRKA